MLVFASLAIGIAAALTLSFAMRHKSMAHGLGAIIASFVIISAATLIAKVYAPEHVLWFGVLTTLTFLIGATLFVLRAASKN